MLVYFDELYRNFDDKSVENLHACYIDFEKAFDTVDHSVLKRKLEALVYQGSFYSCWFSHLSEQKSSNGYQRVHLTGASYHQRRPTGFQFWAPCSFLYTSKNYRALLLHKRVHLCGWHQVTCYMSMAAAVRPWHPSDWCANNKMSVNGDKCSISSFAVPAKHQFHTKP